MSLLPGPATIVRYIRRYVITEYAITGLYCTTNQRMWLIGFLIESEVLKIKVTFSRTELNFICVLLL